MKSEPVARRLNDLMDQPGITGCALVDTDTGLIWLSSGQVPDDRIWEAAVSYWRLHRRQHAEFAGLGPLGAAVLYHERGVLAVLPCCSDPDILMVSLGAQRGVDWLAWQKRVREFGRFVALQGRS